MRKTYPCKGKEPGDHHQQGFGIHQGLGVVALLEATPATS